MAKAINLFYLLILTIFFYTCNAAAAKTNNSLPSFPAIIIIGDSVMDTGNNNYINTWVKANYPPYGQDYPGHVPTGRFSNAKLIPDMLASILGIKEAVPPYLNPTLSMDDLITGVNLASAGSGFDDLTKLFSNVISISRQMEYFREYIAKLKVLVGEEKTMQIINNALVILSAGTNDWIFNYYDVPIRRFKYNLGTYQDFLLDRIHNFTKELYDLGCRKMIVSGLAPTGCLPVQLTLSIFKNPSQSGCLDNQNIESQAYNQKLVNLLSQMQTNLPGSKIVYNDLYTTLMDMITNPNKYGFEETKKGCCGSGKFKTSFLCDSEAPTCEDHSKFVFWDMIHPTLKAYENHVNYMVNNVLPKFL